MIKNLHVENFKAWKTLDIEFGKVTGLFGTNSSGKSSLIQFLLLLKQTKNATDRGLVLDFGSPDQYVNLGSYKDIIHKHDMNLDLSWSLNWSMGSKLDIKNPFGKRTDVLLSGNELSLKSTVKPHNKYLRTEKLEYTFSNTKFSIEPKPNSPTEFNLNTDNNAFKFTRAQARVWALPGPIKTYLFPDQAKTYFQNTDFLSLFEVEYENLMDRIFYLGPLRDFPRREYQWSGASPIDVGKKGERTVDAILAATNRAEKRNLGKGTRYKEFQAMIAFWLKKLGLISEFSIDEIAAGANLYKATVKRDKSSSSTLLTDVGFGVSQVLPAIALLYYVPEGSIVLMEQPEIHLHPSVQSALADVILTAAKTRNLQVIVESHSEHLLRRFQRRVAESDFDSSDIKLYFCDSKDGQSTISNLDLNIFGEICNWPENFFGDEMAEIAQTRLAAINKKIQIEQQ